MRGVEQAWRRALPASPSHARQHLDFKVTGRSPSDLLRTLQFLMSAKKLGYFSSSETLKSTRWVLRPLTTVGPAHSATFLHRTRSDRSLFLRQMRLRGCVLSR